MFALRSRSRAYLNPIARSTSLPSLPGPSRLPSAAALLTAHRTYASKKSKGKSQPEPEPKSKPKRTADAGSGKSPASTDSLVPRSQLILESAASRALHDDVDGKMSALVEGFQMEVAQARRRAQGAVTPDVLGPVRVALPGTSKRVGLEEVATVGVRDGTVLVVTVFDEEVRVFF